MTGGPGYPPGSGESGLENEGKPLEDLQMARCKVSCPPPPSITGPSGLPQETGDAKPQSPTAPFGRGQHRRLKLQRSRARTGLKQGSLARTNNRDARDASGAMHGVSESGDPHVFRHAPVLSGVERRAKVKVAVEERIRIQGMEGSCWPQIPRRSPR